MLNKNFEIMDVTLRDGSYSINFQFSEADTIAICKELDNAGIKYIEIGHGVGLNASNAGNGDALCTDEEYLEAAQSCGLKAKYGMFCIPGVARVEDINILFNYGASFVRIGTNIDDVESSMKYIELAKNHGLEVMANYMKSYAASVNDFRENVRKSKSYGADAVYIVDSAGGMSKEQIRQYYEVIREEGGVKAGFHGHNNMGLALSNAIYAVEQGFDYVDTSLKGMGRSSGNASTELLCANLLKWHGLDKYECKKLIEIGENYIKPLYNHSSHNALDIYSGIADFHSSYMKYIHKYSSKFGVSPLELIVEYCKLDKVNLNEGLMRKVASELPKIDTNMTGYGFQDYFGSEQK